MATNMGNALRSIGRVLANRRLRNVQIAGLGSTLGTWAYAVALPVYAYHAGGPRAVGLLFFARFMCSALAAPWLGVLADRWSRRQLMLTADLIRCAIFAAMTAVASAGGNPSIVFVLAVTSTIVSSAYPPAQAALLPSLVDSPEELTAANVVGNTISSVGMFAGPALGGILLALSGPPAVFALNGALFVWSAVFVARVPRDDPPKRVERPRLLPELKVGFSTVLRTPALRVVIGLTAAQEIVYGALEVLLVVLAIRLLDTGNAGVGWLNTAIGVGSLAGGAVAAVLAARRRLAGAFAFGILLWGIPIAAAGFVTTLAPGLILMGIVGIGAVLVQVNGITLLQRSAENEVLGRVFAVLTSLQFAACGLGALVAPGLVSWLGPKGAMITTGAFLPVLLVPLWPALRRIDLESGVAEEPLEVLRRIEIFAELPEPVIEHLAAGATAESAESGRPVVTQGEVGHHFYCIAAGRAAVDVDGAPVRELGPGDCFGEIALLRDVPRTATVRALEPLRLYTIAREDFIAAVTGHAPTLAATEAVLTGFVLPEVS
jgi:MFS family permease